MSGEINAVLQDENTKTTQKDLMATCSTRHVDLTLAPSKHQDEGASQGRRCCATLCKVFAGNIYLIQPINNSLQ